MSYQSPDKKRILRTRYTLTMVSLERDCHSMLGWPTLWRLPKQSINPIRQSSYAFHTCFQPKANSGVACDTVLLVFNHESLMKSGELYKR